MFDDENVSMVTSEDILKLSGGGLVYLIVLTVIVYCISKTMCLFIAHTVLFNSGNLEG